MSRTMNRLQQSELPGFQQHHVANPPSPPRSHRGASIALSLLILLVPSLIVAGGLLYQQRSTETKAAASEPLVQLETDEKTATTLNEPLQPLAPKVEEKVVELESEPELFAIRPAPEFGQLKALPRQLSFAEVNEVTAEDTAQQTQWENEQDSVVLGTSNTESEQSLIAAEPEPLNQNPQSTNSEATESDLLQGLDLTELSPELALKIESILDNNDSSPEVDIDQYRPQPTIQLESHTRSLSGRLPSLNLQTHMYSSSAERRWVKINDKEVAQGEWVTPEVQLIEVKPQSIVVEFEEQAIEIPALYEWQG
ncbi:general secretion pathway protein GspB [Vibrio sp. D404a]|uniref:general secretion pathway protein GspB n=1 Tax=unclassified Vibrio TaxID=2614977 RepID=UPI0025560BC1|nr:MULTISPECIES: general secretion pathway protein GspB [unclassified Vibrio]MDK9737583.1 general secretion pathway protein GspB [Vibrio sp. D404a]MDK9797526.1 general secretion pathway protein GspB [Vibrio sp. D449a]